MSNPPPSDPTPPFEPPQPYGSPKPGISTGQYPPTENVTPSSDPAPEHPTYQPGYAALPQPPYGPDDPPTKQFPAQPGHGHPGYGPPPPRISNIPLVAVVVAVGLLLCGGAATATVLIGRNVTERAKEAVEPITKPPPVPTKAPDRPARPTLPTDLPTFPDLPNLPGTGNKITVAYEVTGDGPAEIVYAEKLGEKPKRLRNVKLPWKLTTTMDSVAVVSVTAARAGVEAGTIKCRVRIDGKMASESSRDGSIAAVSCTKVVFN